jgi:hypothetical protein
MADWHAGARPELNLIPEELAAILRERDHIAEQRQSARVVAAALDAEHNDATARKADDDAAATAARAGEPIPAPQAVAKLQEDRAAAAHALKAQEAAFLAVIWEAEKVATGLYWGGLEKAAAERAKLRGKIEKQATALADAVEAAASQFEVINWLRTGQYDRSVQTWPTEVIDLSRYGLTRQDMSPVAVRTVILNAATALLNEPDHQ